MRFVFSWSFVLSVVLSNSLSVVLSNIFPVTPCDYPLCDDTFKKLGKVFIGGADFYSYTVQTLERDYPPDYWRYGVSLSWDGETMAVLSLPKSDGSRSARVYTLDYVSSSWIQKGQDLGGDYEEVDISTNGDVVALGGPWSTSYLQPPVFKYNGNTWERMGDEIAGTEDLTLLALSGNGMVIASSGRNLVVVHEHDGTSWSWLGQGIDIADSPTVALSQLGSVLAIGESNQVRVYEYKIDSGRWDQRGQTLTGTGLFGHAVSLDDTGTWLAVGAPDHNSSRTTRENFNVGVEPDHNSFGGMVSVFRYNGTAWNTLGSPLYGTDEGKGFGHSLEMSGAGDRIAVGAKYSCFSSTRVTLYQYDHSGQYEHGTWVQKGEDLYAEDVDLIGFYSLDVALSGDGTVVAFGAPRQIAFLSLVRVYEAVLRPAVPRPTVLSPPASVFYAFDPLGQDIDWTRYSVVALSSSGKIVAVGDSQHDYVRVYEFGYNYSWVQMGQDIQDIDGDDCEQRSVALSASGKIVAVACPLFADYYGQVRVHQYNGNKWEELGGVLIDIDCGVNLDVSFGSSIALSADGSVLASSSFCASIVQRYDGTAWNTLGQQIWGEQHYKQLLSLSSDGCVLAVAEASALGKQNRVRVLKYDNSTGSWIAMGPTIFSKSNLYSVSLSSDGTIVGFGSFDLSPPHSVEVFEYNHSANSWNPLGSPLYGAYYNDYFGSTLDLSSDGHKIVVGSAYYNNGNCSMPHQTIGKVAVYQYDVNGAWLQVGDDLVGEWGEVVGEVDQYYIYQSGMSVALSGDGAIFASGGLGRVRVYQLSYTYTKSYIGYLPDSFGCTSDNLVSGEFFHNNVSGEFSDNLVSGEFSDNLVSGEFHDYGTIFPSGGASGDPHFKTWSGESYDFHGLCDLVLLKNHDFNSGLGMDIHIRTKKMKHWSFVSNAVLRIGEDTLEIRGDPNGETVGYWINGVEGDKDELTNDSLLPRSISGFPIFYRRTNLKQHEFMVNVGYDEKIVVKTWKELVRVDVHGATEVNFGKSLGLMGTFGKGLRVGRDGRTVLPDVNDFGQEWQVLSSEPLLFHGQVGPQAPQKCALPSSTKLRRRLTENTISFEQAMIACAVVDEADRDMCIFDVMATNDLEISGAY